MTTYTPGMVIDPYCKVCKQPNRRLAIEADWADNLTPGRIVERQRSTGFIITVPTLNKHMKLHGPPGAWERKPNQTVKKDLAVEIQRRTLEWIDQVGEDGKPLITPEHPAWASGTAPGLQATRILDTRAQKSDDRKMALLMGQLLLGGFEGSALAPPELMAGDEIEGEAVEVDAVE